MLPIAFLLALGAALCFLVASITQKSVAAMILFIISMIVALGLFTVITM